MSRAARGRPTRLEERRHRVTALLGGPDLGVAREPLGVLGAVLDHQIERIEHVPVPRVAAAAGDVFPLIHVHDAVEAATAETHRAALALRDAVPSGLAEAAAHIDSLSHNELAAIVEIWLDDSDLVEPRLEFWVRVGAAPILERGAALVARPSDWHGRACPACGANAAVSVIAEETGEFMAGSPRSLVCAHCAFWWSYPRATCTVCGENSVAPRSYLVDDRRSARVDTCSACQGYIKTFDLREAGGHEIVPLVDDIATLTLDVWAQHKGYHRSTASLAGV